MMRVLHVVKTVEGAKWAVEQVAELVRHGIEVHVALPQLSGRFIEQWYATGARLHELAMDFPVREPWRLPSILRSTRRLVDEVKPDLIHSHFFGTTLVLRYALGKNHFIPRIFQVPGPLHLEHSFFRRWEISSSGDSDYWIGSSRCILEHYRKAGVPENRLFLSYYGNRLQSGASRQGGLRTRLGISDQDKVIGNINYLYPPKWYLGQTRGLKRHEDVIDALGLVIAERSDVMGVLIGGQWGVGSGYESRLRKRAEQVGHGRIMMPGYMTAEEVRDAWADFDFAVHVPASENCGGVVEPLMAAVPVIASQVGGLPEVVIDGVTGLLVESGNVEQLAETMIKALDHMDGQREMARCGRDLVVRMFDVSRTAMEVKGIYDHLLHGAKAPLFFETRVFAMTGNQN